MPLSPAASPAATSSAWAISRRASDISKLRDFNMFALGVTVMATIMQRASWFGNDSTNSAKTPHEQKIAGILGHWRIRLFRDLDARVRDASDNGMVKAQ